MSMTHPLLRFQNPITSRLSYAPSAVKKFWRKSARRKCVRRAHARWHLKFIGTEQRREPKKKFLKNKTTKHAKNAKLGKAVNYETREKREKKLDMMEKDSTDKAKKNPTVFLNLES